MISNTYVPPSGPKGAPILLVGESPGAEEELQGAPFVGESGQILMNVLGRAGKTRGEVRLMNLSNYRPAANKFEELLGSEQLIKGKKELEQYLYEYTPNVIGALGKQTLQFFTGQKSIHAWRGSILPCSIPGLEHVKVIPTFHPAYVLRDRTTYPIFDQDIKRIVLDSEFPELRYTQRKYILDPRGLEREEWTQYLCSQEWIGTDIEWVTNSTHILCIGFAPTPNLAVVLVNDGSAHYHECVQRILKSKAKKIFHFGTADTAVLRCNGFIIENYEWDTLVAQHVMQPELPRSLAFLASVYTREPYYKSSGRDEIPSDTKSWGSKVDKLKLYEYNAKDCCVTTEIFLEQQKELNENERRIFRFEMDEVTELAPHISDAGILVDIERREIFRRALLARWYKLQALLDLLAGAGPRETINVKSPKLKTLLYDTLGLPVKRKRGTGGQQGTITCDEDAIVQNIGHCADKIASYKTKEKKDEWRKKLGILRIILEIRGVRQLLSNYINVTISPDNRIRSIYKISNTETGRWAAEAYIDGTGNNAQTWPREALEIPDEILNAPADWDGVSLFELEKQLDDEVEDTEYATSTEG